MKLSIKRISMFVLTLLALTFSALGITPAYAANAQKGTVDTHMSIPPTAPTVTTDAIDPDQHSNNNNIQQTTATIRYHIDNLGSDNPTAHGVVYNTSGTPTIAGSKVDNGAANAIGGYSANLTNLTAGTTYYVRAFATNTAGTAYGSEFSFNTKPGLFNVTAPLADATGVSTSPTLSWGTSQGATNYQYCYQVDPAPATSYCFTDTDPHWTSTNGATSVNISGLTSGTKYIWAVRGFIGTSNFYVYAGDKPWYFTTSLIITPSFTDVPATHWAFNFIERLRNTGITSGCGTGNYCPDNTVNRSEMAVFLLKGMHNSGFTPPAINGVTNFADVATSHWAAAWIKQLAAEGITSGCGNGNYCPDNSVTRAQMAVFLLKAKHGTSYSPPAINGSTGFGDIATDYWAAAWIKQLAAEGVTSGCGNGNYCPEDSVTRAQMAVFLVKAFGLP